MNYEMFQHSTFIIQHLLIPSYGLEGRDQKFLSGF